MEGGTQRGKERKDDHLRVMGKVLGGKQVDKEIRPGSQKGHDAFWDQPLEKKSIERGGAKLPSEKDSGRDEDRPGRCSP